VIANIVIAILFANIHIALPGVAGAPCLVQQKDAQAIP